MLRMLVLIATLFAVAAVACSSAAQLTVVIEGYNGSAVLNLTSDNFTREFVVENGSVLDIPAGSYQAELYALNKTFVKTFKLENSSTVKFNLQFTNSTHTLSIFYHVVVFPSSHGFDVSEVIIIRNNGNVNFEGDLSVPLPPYTNFRVHSSSLSFIDVTLHDRAVEFKDLLVAENSSGQIAVSYTLKSNIFEIKLKRPSELMLLTTAEVTDKSDTLSYAGVRNFGGKSFKVYEGRSDYFFISFGGNVEINVNPLAIFGIALVAGSIFLYLYDRSGGWRFGK